MVRLKPLSELSRSSRYRIKKVLDLSSTDNDTNDEEIPNQGNKALDDTIDQYNTAEDGSDDNFGDAEDNNDINSLSFDDSEDSDCDYSSINSDNDVDSSTDSDQEANESADNIFSDSSSLLSDSSESSSDDEYGPSFFTDHLNDFIYPGASLTLGESVLCILTFIIRHKVTKVLIADLLSLINLHCIQPNYCIQTLYYFGKFFKNMQMPLQHHFFCSICFSKLNDKKSICQKCKKRTEVCYFIQVPLIPQLHNLFKRSGFYNALQTRFTRQKINRENLEDIWDGEIYQSYFRNNGILSSPSNISFTWNTDGISLFKSSKFNIWPFYLTINELPFKDRTKKQNILLAGLWFGSKPEPNLFMNSFRDDLKKIYRGVYCRVRDLNEMIKVRGHIICGTCDLPAKASFLNMKGHTSIFGCCHCEIKSQSFNRRRVFPFKNVLKMRTTENSVRDGCRAFESKKSVKGIKGPTVLSQLVHNVFERTVVDVMHCVYLGVTKRLFSLWFDTKYKVFEFSLADFKTWIDEKLCEISPPAIVSRLTRSVNDYKYWKASEWKQWLLYYSLPLLSSIMEKKYLDHHKLLVLAFSYLSSFSISDDMINAAEVALKKYVFKFRKFYGLTHMTCNLHSLLHLADVVRKFGPLPTTSCFAFEDLNGSIRRLVNGTRYTQLQVCSTLSYFSMTAELKLQALQENANVTSFCQKLESSVLKRRKLHHIYNKTFVFGKLTSCKYTDYFKNAIAQSGAALRTPKNVYTFKRLYKDSIVYDSLKYLRKRKTNSSAVIYRLRNRPRVGIIDNFLKICYCNQNTACNNNCNGHFFAIITRCAYIRSLISNSAMDLIYLCRKSNFPPLAIDLSELITVCYYIENHDNDPNTFFIIKPVSTADCD